jgi:type IV secretion system protein VirB4
VSLSKGFLYSQLPWCFITRYGEGVVVQKDGVLQRTFAYRAPDVDSSGPLEISGITLRLNDAVKRLGSGWAVFIEACRFFTTEYPKNSAYASGGFTALAPYLIDREREAAFSAAGSHFESSYYITFTWKPPSENIKKLTRMFIAAAEEDAGTIKENVTLFMDETNGIAALLANNMLIAPLDNDQTVAYLHSAVSLNRHPIRFPHTQILLDRVLPDMALQNSNTMMLGDYYIPIIGVNDFPDSTYPAILDSLNRARLEYRWVTRYLCLDKEDGKKETAKKEKAHRGNRETFLQTFMKNTSGDGGGGGVRNHGAEVKEADSIAAAIEIETDAASLGYYTSSVMVWDTDLKAARKKADVVRAIINGAGFTCKEETFNALEAWKAMMPGQCLANFRALPVMSYNFSHVLPLSSVWAGQRFNEHALNVSGVGIPHITCSTAEGTPFFLNINVNDVGHTAVWGPTGAGKSTFLNLLEAQFLKYQGAQVVVFDKGRSCRALCLACGGLFYEPAADTAAGVAFQPLRDLETDLDMDDAQEFIETAIAVNNYNVSPPMSAAIKETLELLREKPPETRTITSFLHYINYLDPDTGRPVFKEMIGDYLWAGGKYGKIFDSAASAISLDNRFTVFEMEELMQRGDGCVVPALVYLFNLVEKKFDGRLSMLVLDEAWLFLKHPVFADKLAEWLKVLRKRNVYVIFATQDVADVEKSPLKTTVVQQCLTKIYLADPAAVTVTMREVYRAFGLSEPEIDLIAAARMKRDYFYTSPLGRRLFRLDLGPLQLALLGSPDHELLDRLAAEHGGGSPLTRALLGAKGVGFSPLLGADPPRDAPPRTVEAAAAPPHAAPPVEPDDAGGLAKPIAPAALIMDEVAKISGRRKNGQGRAAQALAVRLGVGVATIARARKVLERADEQTLALVREGKISINRAARLADARAQSGA